MINWLMRTSTAPTILDGLLAFQITGSPVPALVALAAPIIRTRLQFRENNHA